MKNRKDLVALAAALALGCGGKSSEQPGGSASGPQDAGTGGVDAPEATAPVAEASSNDSSGDDSSDANALDSGSTSSDGSEDASPAGAAVTLASMQEPGAIAIDTSSVYWTNNGVFGDATVRKVPIAGGPPTILATQQTAGPIAVDATNVYFAVGNTNGMGSSLRKVPIGGGTPIVLASDPGCVQTIAVDATSLYWTQLVDCLSIDGWVGSVMKVSLDGGLVTTVASGQKLPSDLAVDATNVYWTNGGTFSCPLPGYSCADGTVMTVPIAGGTPTTLASGGWLKNIAVDATSVYWLNYGTVAVDFADAAILKTPIGSGPVTTLASVNQPSGMAINGTSLYWVDVPATAVGNGAAVIKKVPLSGGAITTVGPTGTNFLGALLVDSTSVYWGNGGQCGPARPDGTSTCAGAVMKLSPN